MANVYRDVLRIFDSSASTSVALRNKQLGFETDNNNRMLVKDAGGTVRHYPPENSDATFGNLIVAGNVYHDGDLGTQIAFSTETINITAPTLNLDGTVSFTADVTMADASVTGSLYVASLTQTYIPKAGAGGLLSDSSISQAAGAAGDITFGGGRKNFGSAGAYIQESGNGINIYSAGDARFIVDETSQFRGTTSYYMHGMNDKCIISPNDEMPLWIGGTDMTTKEAAGRLQMVTDTDKIGIVDATYLAGSGDIPIDGVPGFIKIAFNNGDQTGYIPVYSGWSAPA